MKRYLIAAFFGVLFTGTAAWALESRKVDMDGDGFREADVLYEGGRVVRAVVDNDRDGRADGTIFYKAGRRDHAELDTNRDGKIDSWISYYFTGVPWRVIEDLNRDGVPDYWSYLKNGVLYRWEQDRNRDGMPDIRTTYDVATGKKTLVEQSLDDDFDGIFENMSNLTAANREAAVPHSLAEALLR
ncbi:MAG TPA: hypothetical protein VL404_02685 [Candidatus Eisenbacteria bacterium]|nr:hypothetical protein [Candidatus Eisenbacteria bacterium]